MTTTRPHVLIVDDDPGIRILMQMLLTRAGCDVDCAGDGAEALALLESEDEPDCVLLDLMLPNVSGFDVLTALRQTRPALLERVIVVTAVSDRTLREVATCATVRAVVRKPFDIDHLVASVRACSQERPVS